MIQHIVKHLDRFEVNGLKEVSSKYRYFDVIEYGERFLVNEVKLLNKDFIYDEVLELSEQICDLPLGEELELNHKYYGIDCIVTLNLDENLLFDMIKVGLIRKNADTYFRSDKTVLELIEECWNKYLMSFNKLVRLKKNG